MFLILIFEYKIMTLISKREEILIYGKMLMAFLNIRFKNRIQYSSYQVLTVIQNS